MTCGSNLPPHTHTPFYWHNADVSDSICTYIPRQKRKTPDSWTRTHAHFRTNEQMRAFVCSLTLCFNSLCTADSETSHCHSSEDDRSLLSFWSWGSEAVNKIQGHFSLHGSFVRQLSPFLTTSVC